MRKVKLAPSVFLAHAKALENFTAKYPICRAVCKTVTIPNMFRDINIEKLFSGQPIQFRSLQVDGDIGMYRWPATVWHEASEYGLHIHFTYARTTPYSPELEKYLRTKEMGFRGPHFHRETLCTLSTYLQIWRRKTTLTYKSRLASGSC